MELSSFIEMSSQLSKNVDKHINDTLQKKLIEVAPQGFDIAKDAQQIFPRFASRVTSGGVKEFWYDPKDGSDPIKLLTIHPPKAEWSDDKLSVRITQHFI